MPVLTDSTFDEGLTGLVMFHAPWAGPCHMVRPAYDAVAGRFGNQLDFHTFDLDDNPVTPQKYGVRQIPLFILFDAGVPVQVKTGAVAENVIVSMVEEFLDDG